MKEKKKKLRDKCGMIGQGQQPPQKIKTNKIMTIKKQQHDFDAECDRDNGT